MLSYTDNLKKQKQKQLLLDYLAVLREAELYTSGETPKHVTNLRNALVHCLEIQNCSLSKTFTDLSNGSYDKHNKRAFKNHFLNRFLAEEETLSDNPLCAELIFAYVMLVWCTDRMYYGSLSSLLKDPEGKRDSDFMQVLKEKMRLTEQLLERKNAFQRLKEEKSVTRRFNSWKWWFLRGEQKIEHRILVKDWPDRQLILKAICEKCGVQPNDYPQSKWKSLWEKDFERHFRGNAKRKLIVSFLEEKLCPFIEAVPLSADHIGRVLHLIKEHYKLRRGQTCSEVIAELNDLFKELPQLLLLPSLMLGLAKVDINDTEFSAYDLLMEPLQENYLGQISYQPFGFVEEDECDALGWKEVDLHLKGKERVLVTVLDGNGFLESVHHFHPDICLDENNVWMNLEEIEAFASQYDLQVNIWTRDSKITRGHSSNQNSVNLAFNSLLCLYQPLRDIDSE